MIDLDDELRALLDMGFKPAVEVDHASRAHARLSASGTDRWWNCPGSITLTADMPNTSSIYAEEGTAAHEVANLCLEQGMDAIEMVGRTVHGFEVDEDMAEAVQIYLDKCREYRPEDGWEVYFERQFTLERLNPPDHMYGTADFVAIHRGHHLIVVVDLKYGQGVTVKAAGNPQLKYYALGAILSLPDEAVVLDAEMFIAQPRGRGDPIRAAAITVMELMEWSIELMERAKYALDPAAPLQAGPWCKFCPAAGQCPEQANVALRVAQAEFDQPDAPLILDDATMDMLALLDVKALRYGDLPPQRTEPYPDAVELAKREPIDVTLLSHEQVGALLHQLDRLEEWAKALRQVAIGEMQANGVIPGWALKPTKPTRKWTVQGADETHGDYLALMYGIPREKLFKQTLISPAQAEQVIAEEIAKGGGTKAKAKERAKELLAGEWEPRSSGVTLTPASDAYPEPAGRGSEFDLLPAESVNP